MRLLLIRHAESRGDLEGRLQGRREFPLTERGIEQARALAARLAADAVHAVYSSPIRRAHDTALEIGRACGLQVNTDPRLQEYDFGELLSGLTWREIRERQPGIVAALANDKSEFPNYAGEEGRAVFRERVCSVFAQITERHRTEDTVAVVTHAGPITVYLFEVLGRPYSRPIPFTIENASITTVEIAPNPSEFVPAAIVTGINDTCHLDSLKE